MAAYFLAPPTGADEPVLEGMGDKPVCLALGATGFLGAPTLVHWRVESKESDVGLEGM